MIVVRLQGGLGNQMFQYAAGRRLAHRHGTSLKLDPSLLGSAMGGRTSRPFALAPFAIQAAMAGPPAVLRNFSFFERAWSRLFRPRRLQVREKGFGFDPGFLDLSDDVCLEGHWQSEKYFRDIAGLIRSEFTVKSPLRGPNRELACRIQGCNSVSVHVRRGDYVSNPVCRDVHGTCNLEYYRAAVEILSIRVRDPHCFLFSDDPGWVRENLALPYRTAVIDHNGPGRAYEDLRLISLCRHHIIANSTFSWWGAWLSGHPEKTVIAPARWFRDESLDTADLCPDAWIRI